MRYVEDVKTSVCTIPIAIVERNILESPTTYARDLGHGHPVIVTKRERFPNGIRTLAHHEKHATAATTTTTTTTTNNDMNQTKRIRRTRCWKCFINLLHGGS